MLFIKYIDILTAKEKLLMSLKTQKELKHFTDQVKAKKVLSADEFKSFLITASENYYNDGKDLVSDSDFDLVRERFEELHPDDSYFNEVGSLPSLNKLFAKESHTIPMGSLQKTPSLDELFSWADKNGKDEVLVCSEKVDGLSVDLTYDNGKLVKALSRGDGKVGENITQNVLKMDISKLLPVKGVIKLRGEIILSKSSFDKHFKDKGMANPRNAAVGAVKRLNGEGCEYLTILCYNLFSDDLDFETQEAKLNFIKDKLKLKTPEWKIVKVSDVKNIWEEYENKLRAASDFEMDGLVLEFNRLELHQELGFVANRPKFAKALKFTADSGETRLNDVIFQVGRSGRITPVALVEPIVLSGATINKASLHNLREINRLGVKIGQTVLIRRSGDVIPQVISVVGGQGTPIAIPDFCPSCGKPTEKDVFIKCLNNKCPAQVYQSLVFWIECLEIKGFGEKLVQQLFDLEKVKSISDFYTLQVKDISGLEKRGEKTAIKVLNELNAKKEITIPEFIKGLGIENVGKSTAEMILTKFNSLEKIRGIKTAEELTDIAGIGETTAKDLIEGLNTHSNLIDQLLKHITIKTIKEVTDGKLYGKTFCFTGFRDKDLEKQILSAGGKMATGVNKTLSYLISEDKESDSEKIKKARSNGIVVLDREDLLQLLQR